MLYFKLKKKVERLESSRYSIKIWVEEAGSGIPPEIFLLHSDPASASQAAENVYTGVCTYADMLNYPAGATDSGSMFFRSRSIYRTYRSRKEAYDFWTTVQSEVEDLSADIAGVHADTPSESETSVESTFKYTKSVKNGGDGNSQYFSYEVEVLEGQTGDPAVFLVQRLSANTNDIELVGVCSYADLDSYGDTEIASGLYRTSSIFGAVSTAAKLAEVTAEIESDLATILTLQANLNSSPDEQTVDVSQTEEGPFIFGDPGEMTS